MRPRPSARGSRTNVLRGHRRKRLLPSVVRWSGQCPLLTWGCYCRGWRLLLLLLLRLLLLLLRWGRFHWDSRGCPRLLVELLILCRLRVGTMTPALLVSLRRTCRGLYPPLPCRPRWCRCRSSILPRRAHHLVRRLLLLLRGYLLLQQQHWQNQCCY